MDIVTWAEALDVTFDIRAEHSPRLDYGDIRVSLCHNDVEIVNGNNEEKVFGKSSSPEDRKVEPSINAAMHQLAKDISGLELTCSTGFSTTAPELTYDGKMWYNAPKMTVRKNTIEDIARESRRRGKVRPMGRREDRAPYAVDPNQRWDSDDVSRSMRGTTVVPTDSQTTKAVKSR